MRIGIDVCCWTNPRGFGRYTRALVQNLVQEFGDVHQFILVCDETTSQQMPSLPEAVVRPVRLSRRPIEAASAEGWRSPLDLLRLGVAAYMARVDVFFFPTVYSYFPIPGRVPVIVTIHDTMTEKRPELFFATQRARLFWRAKVTLASRRASLIVTPSQTAQKDVTEILNIPLRRTVCVGEAADGRFTSVQDTDALTQVLARYGIPEDIPLLLYVGGLSPHKNIEGLLHALALLARTPQPWHLVLVGEYEQDSYLSSYRAVKRLSIELGLAERMSFTGFVPDSDLLVLYNGATMLVLPSLDEGFGLPLVEAMACGLPIAASNRGAIPEVLADAGLMFDPERASDIAMTVSTLLEDGALRLDLGRRGLTRAAQFSWRVAARRMMSVLETFARE